MHHEPPSPRSWLRLPRVPLCTALLGASSLTVSPALAQEPAPEAAPAPAGEAGGELAPAPPATAVAAETPVPEEPTANAAGPETPTPADPDLLEEFKSTFTIGVGARTGLNVGLAGPTQGQVKLDDGLVDQGNIRPFMAGNFTKNLGFFTQFEIGTPSGLGTFAILDLIAQIKLAEELQVWVGQHIPANDRNNMNGPFFGNGWNFAIGVPSYPFDTGARDRGATVWGLVAGGHLKYHASVVDLQPGRDMGQARYGGRVTLHFLEPENFYYNSGTYFGTQDILTVGAVFQGQSGQPTVADDDFVGFSFDAMFEKNFGPAGTFTLEAGYWNFDNTGVNYAVNQYTVDGPPTPGPGGSYGVGGPYGEALLASASWLTPNEIGIGKLQPNVRLQYGDYGGAKSDVIDAGVAYVIDGFNHKYHLNYRHTDNDGLPSADMIQFGVQYMMSK